MNYEKIIVELLSRIQILEEQVAELIEQKNTGKGEKTMSTKEIREYIQKRKIE